METPPVLQRHTWVARMCAFTGGSLLALFSVVSYWASGYADDAVRLGSGEAANQLGAEEYANWIERAANNAIGGDPSSFQMLTWFAFGAGIVAVLAALPRSPLGVWQEWVWGIAAVVSLAPNFAWGWWFTVWAFSGALVAGAAALHYVARRDDLVRMAAAGAKQAGVAGARQAGVAATRWRDRRGGRTLR